MHSFRLIPLAFVLALCAPACSSSGGDDDTSGNPQGAAQPSSTSVAITAADGGDVALGDAKLSIPGGALADDTTVTVASSKPSASLPDASSVEGLLYDFGPTGTTFAKPVALTLPIAKSPGDGKEAVISYLNEDTNSWEDLTTTVSAGSVSADIMHFSKYVVRIRNVNVSGDFDCAFTACGGNPVGSWQIAGACISGDAGDNPFGDSCPDATIGIDVSADGTLDLTSDRYTWNLSVGGTAHVTIPPNCVQTLGKGQATDCSDFAGDNSTCTGSITVGCDCATPIDPSTETSTGTYTTQGNSIVGTDDDSGEAGTPTEFCVQNNQLKIQIHPSDSTQSIVLVLTK